MAYTRRRSSRRATRSRKGGKRISMKKIGKSHKRKLVTKVNKTITSVVKSLKGVPLMQKQKLMQNLKQTLTQGVQQGVMQTQKQQQKQQQQIQ